MLKGREGMLKGREGMLKGRGGDVEGRGEDVEGNGGANGKGDGEGMVLRWHHVILPRRRRMLWSRRRRVASFRVVVVWLCSASSSLCVVTWLRHCALAFVGGRFCCTSLWALGAVWWLSSAVSLCGGCGG